MSVKGFYVKGIKGLALLDGKSSAGLRHSDVSAGVFSGRAQRRPYLSGSVAAPRVLSLASADHTRV